MIPITIEHYFRDFRTTHALEFNPAIEKNALVFIGIANNVLREVELAGVQLYPNAAGNMSRSGWRPPSYNKTVPNAATFSLHMDGRAGDIEDPSGEIDEYLYGDWRNNGTSSIVVRYGIWCEHPSATKSWAHWQTVPPKSKNRWFYP